MKTFQRSAGTYLRRVYRRAMAPRGLAKVREIVADSAIAPLRVPLEFLFTSCLEPEDEQAVARVEELRVKLACSDKQFEVASPHTPSAERSAEQIALRSSITKEWGTFLYLCAKSLQASSILEMGSCAGISGSYLASAKSCQSFVTVEASPSLAEVAKVHLAQIAPHATIVNGLFEDVVPQLLRNLDKKLDLVYIDGQHTYDATLHYFEMLNPSLNKGCLLIFDDIHWSSGMWDSWLYLQQQAEFSYTIDVGRVGLCLWNSSASVPKNYSLSLFTGWRTHSKPAA